MTETISITLKSYPHTTPLKTGAIGDPALSLAFTEIEPIHRAFAPMARTQNVDVCEMAIVTYLLAKAYDKPIILLPAVVAARFQMNCLIANKNRRLLTPADLPGATVGVRAYTQTTGMWVRGILAADHGVPIDKVHWLTFEGAHLAEYHDPSFTRRAPAGEKLLPTFEAGKLDAAILGNDLPDDPDYVPVVEHPEAADLAWYNRHHFVPINHMVVVSTALAAKNPDAVRRIYRLIRQGIETAPKKPGPDKFPCGIEALHGPMELILDYCERQQLLPRKLTVDEIFADTRQVLKDEAE
jgi:4,5-dihydroxyphthalate decarboxylase